MAALRPGFFTLHAEHPMTALVIWAFRLLILFVIIRIVLSFMPKKPGSPGKKQEKTRRFDATGKKVEDADFKEL
jgi:hypothetical protein